MKNKRGLFTDEALFNQGNYTTVAMYGDQEKWYKHAALGLIGRTHDAIAGLDSFENDIKANFYSAVSSWIGGDEMTAIKKLDKIPSPHAQNLLSLIRKPKIKVLSQLPWNIGGPQDLLQGIAQDNKFQVQNLGYRSKEATLPPYADIHNYYDAQDIPDFYIAAMVEWHLIPPNLQEIPCPIFAQTSDYDLHIQIVYPWLQLFDELLVLDGSEWADVHRLVTVPVSTFPKSFGLANRPPKTSGRRRDIDVFLSGTLMHPYGSGKAKQLYNILGMPELRLFFINGFIGPEEYKEHLGRSKISITYIRHPGTMPTRGIEALSMGSAVLVQDESVFTLFVGEEEGVLTYQDNTLAEGIRRIIGNWPDFAQRAQRGAAVMRREFSLERVASQYFRFLTFLAARPRPGRKMQQWSQGRQKRPVLWKGWLPPHTEIIDRIIDINLRRLAAGLENQTTPHLWIDTTRDVVLRIAAKANKMHHTPSLEITVSEILWLFRRGLTNFPRSLVMHFNMIRTALHFGHPGEVLDALQLAQKIVAMPESHWQIDDMEDVFPWDFAETYFNYRNYFDLVKQNLMEDISDSNNLMPPIMASLFFYLAHYTDDLNYYQEAYQRDPIFPFYKLALAKKLIAQGETENYAEAWSLLTDLATGSIIFMEASVLLQQLQERSLYTGPIAVDWAQRVSNAHNSIKFIESNNPLPLRYALVQPNISRTDQDTTTLNKDYWRSLTNESLKKLSGKRNYLVSAIVPTYNAERFMGPLLEDLESQTIADQLEILIVDTGSQQDEEGIVAEFKQRYDNIVYFRTAHRENSHQALNRCIQLASGKYLTLACTDDRHRPDAFERMAGVLEDRPDIALVYADVAITNKENQTLKYAPVMGYYRYPEFDLKLLFQVCYIGPQPMWRRELHERYGEFDPNLLYAGDYDLWLRFALNETFLHIPEVLGLYLLSPTGNEHSHMEEMSQESELARERHWPKDWGQRPPLRGGFFVRASAARYGLRVVRYQFKSFCYRFYVLRVATIILKSFRHRILHYLSLLKNKIKI